MNTRGFKAWRLGLALFVLLLATALDPHQSFITAAQAEPAIEAATDTNDLTVTPESPGTILAPAPDDNPVAPIPASDADKPLPPSVRPSSPTAEVVKLAQAGVDAGVMLAFVTNSSSTFNLDSDDIIYLNDLGVPNEVVTAMLQRDQALKTDWANGGPPPATTSPTTPGDTATPPAQPEPEPAYATEPGSTPEPQPVIVNYNYFYDSLSPYGSWVDIDGYGRCWQPTVAVITPGWQPYCDRGHWIYTDCGWYWTSDYSWGWAAFHYGRWFQHPRWGWCWWPDSVWAPAWVSWRYSDAYCGWAALPPSARYRPGVGFTYNNRAVGVGFNFGLRASSYSFVPWRHFYDSRPYTHRLPRQEATRIYDSTTMVNNIVQGNNNTVINRGVPADRVRALTQADIRPVTIREAGAGAMRDIRGEHLDRDGRTLAVRRPLISPGSANPPNGAVTGGLPPTAPQSSVIVIGRRDSNPGQNRQGNNSRRLPPQRIERSAPPANNFPRPAMTQDFPPAPAREPAPSYNRPAPQVPRITPGMGDRSVTRPVNPAPAPVVPPPAGYAPVERPRYSAPPADFTPRTVRPEPVMPAPSRVPSYESRPAAPAPAPPPPAAPAAPAQDRSQGGRNGPGRP